MSDKTEEPTPRRLKKAREEGDSPVSGALVQAVGFVVAMALVPAALTATVQRASVLVHRALADPFHVFSAAGLARDVVVLTVPMVGAAALAGAAVGFLQSGGVIAAKKIAPDLNRANPITGLKNVFNWQRAVSVLRSLAAALIVGWLAVRLIVTHGPALVHSIGSVAAAAGLASELSRRLAWIAALVGLGLAGVDVLITRYSWKKRLKMSKDEVKREFKETEGDPEIKAARQRAHQEMLSGATIAAVKEATVVIVNPTHIAAALRYEESDEDRTEETAPRLVAKGEGDLARRIVDAARAYGVPVVRDVPVARALSELEIGDEIPEALYEAVAEILREVWEQAKNEADST
jgi:flagellar biosynthesis protein FlhB